MPGLGRRTSHPASRLSAPLCLIALLLSPAARAQEDPAEGPMEEAGAEAEAAGEPEATPPEESVLSRFRADPTLGGKLHLTYRARYEGKFFRFHGYRFNFPGEVSVEDLQMAAEIEARHRRRSTDHDLDQYLALRTRDLFVPGKEKGYLAGLDTELSLRYFQDLDGSPAGDEAVSTYDYLDAGERFQLRTLNARLQLLEKHLEVTGGRLYHHGAEWVLLDGARATARGLALLGRPFELEGFGGSRVSFFSTVSRSTVWGGAFRIWPWKEGRLSIESLYFLENSLQATFEQRLGQALSAVGVYRQIDEDPESLRLELRAELDERRLSFRVEYLGKLGGPRSKDFIYDYTTPTGAPAGIRDFFRYFNLGDLDPFDEGTLEARWAPGGALGYFLGFTGHLLRGGGERDQFNTDWFEVWGGADSTHFPWEGLTARAQARYVHTDLPRRAPAFVDPLLVADVRADGEPTFVGVELLIEQDLARRFWVGSTLEFRFYEYDSRFARADFWGLGATAFARYRQNRYLTYSLTYAYDRDYRFLNPDLEDVHGVRLEAVVGF